MLPFVTNGRRDRLMQRSVLRSQHNVNVCKVGDIIPRSRNTPLLSNMSDYGEYSDEDGGDTHEVDEEEYPDLPFPDDYWTYDAEAKNYYHTDREEDGRETKIWYPLEFL
ncbi:hypothetical protein PG995_004327 [Apiospora arundinis]